MAEEEAAKEERGETAGRRSGDSGPNTELAKAWYGLVQFWDQFEAKQPATDRYTTVPDHLNGISIQLRKYSNAYWNGRKTS